MDPKMYYFLHRNPPLVSVLYQLNPAYAFIFLKLHFKLRFLQSSGLPQWRLPLTLFRLKCNTLSSTSHVCRVFCPSRPRWFDHSKEIDEQNLAQVLLNVDLTYFIYLRGYIKPWTHFICFFTINYNIVAYLSHVRKAEPQNQPFLSNTRTNIGTAGLRDPFLGYGSVNTLSRRRMTSHCKNIGWEARDLSTARYSWRNNTTGFSVRSARRLYNATLVTVLTHVEAGSNTFTVTLRVVEGDEKGSLKSETVKYGHESQGI
jgi:hypothetical protein